MPQPTMPNTPSAAALRNPPNGITIAIPNWNHELVLGRSVGSALRAAALLRAMDVLVEVLVLDDASRDGSATLLRQLEALYFEDGLRVLLRAENSGAPAAVRNQALFEARYRYILFLDADNEVLPENLPLFYRSICDTNAALVYGSLIFVNTESGEVQYLLSDESFQDRIIDGNYIDTLALVDRMQLLEANGFLADERMAGREDWELNLHLAFNGRRLVFVPVVMGYYHAMPHSLITEKMPPEVWQRQLGYVRRAFNQLGLRWGHLLNTRHLRYHPDLGYI
jgi:succinoglycan biosynthesis protein ExoO